MPQIVMITGASAGVGRATAVAFAWEPVDDEQDFGAYGRFGARARTSSWQLWLTQHRRALALVGMGLIGVLLSNPGGRRPRMHVRGVALVRQLVDRG